MDELSFFDSIGNHDPVMGDLLDTASPPELSQVESLDDDEYPSAQYDPYGGRRFPYIGFPHSEFIRPMTRRMILSQLALDSGLLFFFLYPGFLSVFWQVLAFSEWLKSTQVGCSCSFLVDARMGGVGPSFVC